MKHFLYLFWGILFLPLAGRENFEGTRLFLEKSMRKKAAPPKIIDNRILFSYKSPRPVGRVGVIFSTEDFTKVHYFSKNENDVFVYDIPVRGDEQVIKYRFMVDGLWIPDPENGNREVLLDGTAFSLFKIPDRYRLSKTEPFVDVQKKQILFRFKSAPGKRVYLSGNFNAWEPYLTPLREVQPGYYEVRIPLSSGLYRYYFIVNGHVRIDPSNPESGYNTLGEISSSISVP